jgi:hypothetical protein
LRKAQEWREVEVEGRDSFHPLTLMNRAIQRFDGRMEEDIKNYDLSKYFHIPSTRFKEKRVPEGMIKTAILPVSTRNQRDLQ